MRQNPFDTTILSTVAPSVGHSTPRSPSSVPHSWHQSFIHTYPFRHPSHDDAPAGEVNPLAYPAAHCEHSEASGAAAYLPGSHSRHSGRPRVLYWPAGQIEQADARPREYLPPSQGMHVVALVSDLVAYPAPHARHSPLNACGAYRPTSQLRPDICRRSDEERARTRGRQRQRLRGRQRQLRTLRVAPRVLPGPAVLAKGAVL